ncbi:Probable mediator of RNA polymerase II transcription subunit 26c [Striga hermonthica]|uniref:Probable mediator of RNA polymerase II transcription subunit 26c n=1 Tax=Striga hermonthica TaxID=68872 RepID=A0A9N7NVU9_STRHE|nr:Probable mediator of RNA polymerase II transcription subunit 26c [Striga hermonthica]
MDSDEFRAILSGSRVGIWEMIEAAIRVASSDHGDELRRRRDKIVESLYAPAARTCRNCGGDDDEARDHRFHHTNDYTNRDGVEDKVNSPDCNNKRFDVVDDGDGDDDDKTDRNLDRNFGKSPLTPESNHRSFSGGEEGEDVDPYGGLFDDEQTRILTIKEQLEDPNQSEDDVVELLHNLSDMDITFQALKETDIGRHVNRLRKHPSNEVRILVKQLVRKWKETVDDWVKVNQPQRASDLNADVDSPQQNISKNQQNGHHQVPDFGYSPNPRIGSSSAERNYGEHERKPKPPQSAPRREPPSRPPQSAPKSSSTLPPNRAQQREPALDDERLNSARRRLQENYQEAQNAKKQRTIQVMDIHEIPKPKNAYFAKNKGGFQGRSHR